MWLFLQSGWANSAAILAVALVPFVSLGSATLDAGSTQARTRSDSVALEQVAQQTDPTLWTSLE